MKERKAVTRENARRYRRANRRAKPLILNEFIETTKLNRKYAIRLLNGTLLASPPVREEQTRLAVLRCMTTPCWSP